MKIGISSPITLDKFLDYLFPEFHQIAIEIEGLKAPAVDTIVLGLLENGHSVSIYTLSERIDDMKILKGNNLTIFVAPLINHKWWRLFGIFTYKANQIKKCVRADFNQVDLIHAHWTYEYAAGVILGTKQIPIVVTIRDWIPFILRFKHFYYYFIVRYFIDYFVFNHKRVNFIANSQYIAKLVKQKWSIDVPVIPNSVSNFFLSPKKGSKRETFNIISISTSVDNRKNIEPLVKAFSLFNSKYKKSKLFLIGNAFTEKNFGVIRWKTEGLLDNVELLGSIKHYDLIKILDNSDVLVHPSLEESFGNVIIEAIARKVPVIAGKNSGAVPFVLLQGEIGFLCDVTSPISIFESIEYLYKNSSYRKELIENAYDYLLKNYTQEKTVEKHLRYYQKIISKI